MCAYLYVISSLSLFKVGGGIGVRGTTEGEGETECIVAAARII